ncbi:hypothetical protein WKK05_35755 [Nostoc sp. UHCC 0302]
MNGNYWEVKDDELEQAPDKERKRQMMAWAALAIIKIIGREQVKSGAREVVALEFKTFDASHIACAEVGNADIFINN